MEIVFDDLALKDIRIWKKSGNVAVQKRIEKLLLSIKELLLQALENLKL